MSGATPSPPRLSWRYQACLAGGLTVIVLLTRTPTLFRSVLDWDESLYFLMASQWRAGHLPYTTIWDNKPPGIYAIFAVFQMVFGERIVAMRLACVVFVSAGAWGVVNVTRGIAGGRLPALFAGGTFVVCSVSNDGLAANTELFMACFTTLAALTALSGDRLTRPFWHGALTGVLLGTALSVKYVAVFEAPAVGWVLLARYSWSARPAVLAGLALGGALPLAATVLLYWHAGLLGLWWDSAVLANLRRLAPPVPAGAIAYAFGLQLQRWGPLFAAGLLFLVAAARRLLRLQWNAARRIDLFLVLWLFGGLAGVASAKSFYDHYFLQLLPVLSVITGWWLAALLPPAASWPRARLRLVLAAFLLLPAAAAASAWQAAISPLVSFAHADLTWHPDSPSRIAADLANVKLPAGAGLKLYVFDGQPIIYALVHQSPPTRYVLPSVLTKNFLEHVAGIDAEGEVAGILARRPAFIVRDRHPPVNPKTVNQTVYLLLDQTLAMQYRLWRSYGDMDVYTIDP